MSLRTLTHYTSLNEEFNIPTQSRPKVLTREEVECAVGMLNASLHVLDFEVCFSLRSGNIVADRTIGILLSAAFKIRYKERLTKVYTAAHITASRFLPLLTKEETNLYEAAHLSMTAFTKWRTGGPRFQRASILGRKRKESY
ncbi:unnamed protein product [Brassica oleracea var. botrytis]